MKSNSRKVIQQATIDENKPVLQQKGLPESKEEPEIPATEDCENNLQIQVSTKGLERNFRMVQQFGERQSKYDGTYRTSSKVPGSSEATNKTTYVSSAEWNKQAATYKYGRGDVAPDFNKLGTKQYLVKGNSADGYPLREAGRGGFLGSNIGGQELYSKKNPMEKIGLQVNYSSA